MTHPFSFNEEQFNRLFPFYILINKELQVTSIGRSLHKLIHIELPTPFNEFFSIPRPQTPINCFKELIALQNQLVVLDCSAIKHLFFRGQFEYLSNTEEILFVGSPWFNSMEQVTENNLVINDFACHDPLIDLLNVLKSQEITNDDLKQLITTINYQKNDLKRVNKEFQEMALLPTQNPDPIIRISYNGDILTNNPAAAKLDFFEYENKSYRNDEFFILIANIIDKKRDRWQFEASSEGKEYSFDCVTMKEDQYINIYGRDITEQKANERKLERLSLVASANDNGVLFTAPDGKITWANEGFCKLTGYSLEEIIGHTPIDLFTGPISDKVTIQKLLMSFYRGKGLSTEIVYYRKDGTWFWGRSVSQPLKNKEGEIVEFFGIVQNVTEEKASEEKLKVLSQIAEDNINAVVISDAEGKIVWVNKSFVTMTGYTLKDAYGKRPGQLLQGPDSDKSTVEYLKNQVKNGEPFNAEIINYSKSGQKYWLRIQGQPIKNEKGELTGFFALEEDITKEKESENLFKQALENIGDNVWEKDLRTGTINFSKSENEFFGILSEDNSDNQQIWLNAVCVEDLHLLIDNDVAYKKGLQDSHSLEYRIILKNKEIRWVLERGVVIEKDINGMPLRITGTHTDIRERKNTEKILEKQRQFYEDILNAMPADIAVFNKQREYLFVNPSGIKDENLRKWIIGKKEEDYCIYRNKPIDALAERSVKFREIIATKTSNEWEERSLTKDGEEKIMLRRYFPVLNKENEIKIVIGYGIDITQRKKFEQALKVNEEKYRGIIANMNLGLMELDSDSKITFANQTLMKMAGLNDDNAIGYNSILFLTKESLSEVQNRIKNHPNGTREAYEVQTDINGNKDWWLVSSTPKYADTGERIGSIVICLDITKQKKLENELLNSREQAQQLAKAKEVFLANMSHEIRTPMNAIMGMGNQLAKTSLTEQQDFYLSTINTAADNLLVIINDILDLSKIDAGKLSVEKIGFVPQKIIANAMQVLMHKAEEKGLKITNSFCDTKMAPVLIGDPYRINQVLLNLMSNAIKFTDNGSVDINCKVIDETENTQTIQLKVTDTGIGMEKEFVDKLFDKFSQEYDSTSRKFGGTGLGMSISKELIELMGGTIEVKSKKGAGTTVSFNIKFSKGTIADIADKETQKITEGFLKGKTILITDDNDMNRLVASTILKNYGAETLEAVNGEEALNCIANQSLDLVLMDIQMPILNGYDATKSVRSQGNNIPIIALTANAIKGENEKCIDAGMNDYISKPFKEEEFLKKIAHWLNTELNLDMKNNELETNDEKALYDLSTLREISAGNEEFVKKMILLFCEQSPVMVAKIIDSYENNNLEVMGTTAHKLKPSIDNMRINSLKSTIRFIEKCGKEQQNDINLLSYIKETEKVIKQVIVMLKDEFQITRN